MPPALEPRRIPHAGSIVVGVLVLWGLVFAKVGSSLIFGIDDLLLRVRALPDLIVSGDATSDYKNWSVLPYAVGRVLGADTATSFAAVQFVVLVVGSAGVIGALARRRPMDAVHASLGLFACMTPAWVMFNMGTYDQLLVVLLLAVTLVDRPAVAAVLGVLIGATHAEAGVVALIGLLALSAVGLGPRVVTRAWAIGGVLACRAALTVWFRLAGQSGDRFAFVSQYGFGRLIGYLADTWPVVVWSAAAGGWVIIIGSLLIRRSTRLTAVVLGVLAFNLAVTAITADQSRVIMLTTFPLVVALSVYAVQPEDPPQAHDLALAVRVTGAAVGLLAPLTVAWVGDIFLMGDPFQLHW
jgi:hypothetical protein